MINMARIGHASIGSGGKARGDKAGDNNGREVCFSTWSKRNWSYVLRAKDKNIAEKIAHNCELGCLNDKIGYDMNQRNTLRTQAKLVGMQLDRINVDCECDCSSFVSVCCECSGIPIPYPNGNAPTTSTIKTQFCNTGYFDLLTEDKYISSDNFLCRGDILVAAGQHVVIILEDGIMADISKVKTVNNTPIKAVDLSQYNVVTDYKKMANEIKYIFLRIGRRGSSNGQIVEDTGFNKHIKECIANNLSNIGLYFYDQSISEQEAIEQADWIVDKLKNDNISQYINLPIYIDSEYSNNTTHNGRADNISKEQRTKNIIAFCNRIQKLGYKSGVYFSDSWGKSMVLFDQIVQTNYNIWVARYSTQNPTIPKYDIWQYGSEQFIWAQKPIDVNWIYNLPTTAQKPQYTPNTNEIKGNDIIIDNRVQVSDFLNVRLQPLINAPVVEKLYNDNQVFIFGYVHEWYTISTTMDKWVSSKYIKTKNAVTTSNLNYREGVGINSKPLGMYEKGTKVKVLSKAEWTDGTWILCLDENERFGWCSANYLQMI